MRKVLLNKWFILSALLTISLTAFSFVAYQKTRSMCSVGSECCKKQIRDAEKGEVIWDALSHQFSSISIH